MNVLALRVPGWGLGSNRRFQFGTVGSTLQEALELLMFVKPTRKWWNLFDMRLGFARHWLWAELLGVRSSALSWSRV